MANKWRLNFVTAYWNHAKIDLIRPFVLDTLRNYAILYRLDYATSVDHQFSSVDNSTDLQKPQIPADLFYFRSNSDSKISKIDFRKVIGLTFDKPQNTQFGLVEFFFQMVSALKDYPFPLQFYRPLNYPHVEHYKDGQAKHLVYPEPLETILQKEQDYDLN